MVDFGSDLRKRTLILCAALAFAIAASVLLRGRSRPVHLLFGAFAGDMALWYLTQALYGIFQASIWARFTGLLAVLLPQLAIHLFGAIAPDPSGTHSRLPRVAGLLAIPVVILELSTYQGQGWARGVVFFYAFGLVFAALTSLAIRGRQSPSRETKGRVRYLVFVGALATTFSLIDFLWYIGAEPPPVGAVLSVIFLFALAESLDRERLLDLYERLGRLVVFTALAFVLAGIFYLFIIIGRFGTMYLNAVLAAVVILVLFEPLRLKVEEKIHQLFFRERFDLEKAVDLARRQLVHTLEIDQMQATVLAALQGSRRMTSAALFLRDSDESSFELAGSFGVEPPLRIERATGRGLLDKIALRGVLVLEKLGGTTPGEHDPETEAVAAAAAVLGPLKDGIVLGLSAERELLGLLVILDDRVRDAFSPEDLILLESLATQMSVVLENSRVYARMKTRDRLAELGQMAAGLAHEIKNPLGAIKGAAQLMADTPPGTPALDPSSREFLGIILEEVERLDRVVGSVLDYARPSSEAPSPVDVNAVARRTAQILWPTPGDGPVVELVLGDDLPRARIDAEKLRQVLMNLVQNAVQAMDGRGVVTLTTRLRIGAARGNSDPARRWIDIAVSDRGPGISKKVLKNLFVPFFTTKARGTGLGLAISQRVVQSVGGWIEVVSHEGQGTTFTIVLPALEDYELTPLQDLAAREARGESPAPSTVLRENTERT